MRDYDSSGRGVSPVVATLLLILITLAAGGATWVIVRGQIGALGPSLRVDVQNLDVVRTDNAAAASVTVRNAGTVPLERVEVTVFTDNADAPVRLVIENLAPGQSKGAIYDSFGEPGEPEAGDVEPWRTYPVTVRAVAGDNSSVSLARTVTVRG